jgi:hypothetical protein
MSVLLDCRFGDLGSAAIMAEMDDFCAGRLKNPPHDVDRCVMAVEQ